MKNYLTNQLIIMNTIDIINEKIRTAKELDFGTIFSEAIELFKKTWVQGLLVQVFAFLIMLPVILVLYIPLITAAIAQEQNGGYNPETMSDVFAGFSILYIIGFVIAIVILGAVASALNAGFYRAIKMIDHSETVVTKDLFHFVKGPHLSKFLILMLISIVIAIPSALLCYIPLLYVMVPMSLFVPFYAYNPHMETMDVVKASFKLGNKKWLLLFGLVIISSLLAQIVGLLACGIGVLVTASFVYHPVYLVYKKVIGFGDNDEIKQIGENQE